MSHLKPRPGTACESPAGYFPLGLLAGRMTDFADVGAAEERERSVPPPSGTRFPKAASGTGRAEHVGFTVCPPCAPPAVRCAWWPGCSTACFVLHAEMDWGWGGFVA